ncbi:MAG: heavy-metal-associated domain-containing protein [Flavobacteriaceae bacterium]
MNTLKNIIALAFIALLVFNCKNEAQPKIETVDGISQTEKNRTLNPNATYAKAEFNIEGMTCAMGCAKTIEKKIGNLEGVKSSVVDFDKKLAMVEYDQAKVTPALLEETVTKVADVYTVNNMKTVDAFSNGKSGDKSCCADKKESCANKTEAEKAECKKECPKKEGDKACCAGGGETKA